MEKEQILEYICLFENLKKTSCHGKEADLNFTFFLKNFLNKKKINRSY
jgi:hypothetical protein